MNTHLNSLSRNEKIVLLYTYRYKNTYNGRKNIRFVEANTDTGITQEQWIVAQNRLVSKGLLIRHNKALNEISKTYVGFNRNTLLNN